MRPKTTGLSCFRQCVWSAGCHWAKCKGSVLLKAVLASWRPSSGRPEVSCPAAKSGIGEPLLVCVPQAPGLPLSRSRVLGPWLPAADGCLQTHVLVFPLDFLVVLSGDSGLPTGAGSGHSRKGHFYSWDVCRQSKTMKSDNSCPY